MNYLFFTVSVVTSNYVEWILKDADMAKLLITKRLWGYKLLLVVLFRSLEFNSLH